MWYSQGTVAVTNGGTNITGTGTSFLTNARVGDGITITGSTALHEIIGVTSNTQLSIRPAYAGSTGSGRTYGISPLLGYDKDLSDAFNQLRLQFGDQLSNLQPWATASTVQEARDELGASTSGNTVFTGTAAQGRSALGLGVAATRGVVGGGDNLMAEGAYGVGATGTASWPESSLNAANVGGGLYYVADGTTEQPQTSTPRGVLFHRMAGSVGAQIHISDASSLELYARPCRFGTWRAWQKIYHSNNILGGVSQSGGVPTGAIIERGSNANGEYVKFADGSAEALLPIRSLITDIEQEGMWRGLLNVTFPISFQGEPRVIAFINETVNSGALQLRLSYVAATTNITNTSASLRVASEYQDADLGVSALIKGRWY